MSTTSAARIAANKANAQKSTGPRSAEGKARVSENAVKHGLRSARNPLDFAKDTTLPFEQTDFLATLAAFMDQFAPQGPLETLLVERLAQIDLRLNRAVRMETANMEFHVAAVWKNVGEILPTDVRSRDNQLLMLSFDRAAATLKLIHQYESRLSRDFARTLSQLRHAQNHREQTQCQQSPVSDDRVAESVTAPQPSSMQKSAKQTQPPAQAIEPIDAPASPPIAASARTATSHHTAATSSVPQPS